MVRFGVVFRSPHLFVGGRLVISKGDQEVVVMHLLCACSSPPSVSGSLGIGALERAGASGMSNSQCTEKACLEDAITQKSAVVLIFRMLVLRWLIGVCIMSTVECWFDCDIHPGRMAQHLCRLCWSKSAIGLCGRCNGQL